MLGFVIISFLLFFIFGCFLLFFIFGLIFVLLIDLCVFCMFGFVRISFLLFFNFLFEFLLIVLFMCLLFCQVCFIYIVLVIVNFDNNVKFLQYVKFVKFVFDDFVLLSKKYVDVIIFRGGDNYVVVDLIVQYIYIKFGQYDLCKIYFNVYVIQLIFQVWWFCVWYIFLKG